MLAFQVAAGNANANANDGAANLPMQPCFFSTDLILACAASGNEGAMGPALRNTRDPSCPRLSTEVSLR